MSDGAIEQSTTVGYATSSIGAAPALPLTASALHSAHDQIYVTAAPVDDAASAIANAASASLYETARRESHYWRP